jgi:molybdopterin/thiamine biosynthesis adenylyltransferase
MTAPATDAAAESNAFSVALTSATHDQLASHLLRPDGQEDVCLATYAPSTGATRTTALLTGPLLPQPGERRVHGNASFTGAYILRGSAYAAERGLGVALLHSHPRGRGWQQLSATDADAEQSYAHLVHQLTGLPLVGLTLAGDQSWSARRWSPGHQASQDPIPAENVRVIGARLKVSWNRDLRPIPEIQDTQLRTVSAWGAQVQADLASLKILVIGAGTTGIDLAVRLVATGIEHVAVMDFDIVKNVNRDRLVWATREDAELGRRKVDVAMRAMTQATTARNPRLVPYPISVCDRTGLAIALDYDLIFSCVDRPFPRAVLNQIAYTDLIPVIDGGIAIDSFPGSGMRNATWRTHVIRPGRPCLQCNQQIDPAQVALDRLGLLDDPEYIKNAGIQGPASQNVAILAVGVTASQLAQFVSLVVTPGGLGDPGPLQFSLSTHSLRHRPDESSPHCFYERSVAIGDARLDICRAGDALGASTSQSRSPDRVSGPGRGLPEA